jgi:tetratricopeptide (TPR) repeat protein
MTMPNPDEIVKLITEKWELLAAITTILSASGVAGVLGVWKWNQGRRQAKRLQKIPAGDFPFEVIKPHSPDLLKQIMGGDDQNPLADYKIPYQERQPDRSVRKDLEEAFSEKNWVLIVGKSGLGKTREAAHLADVLNQEGWTVLKLTDRSGAWLDVPKAFPSEISPEDKLLFFLDNLNRWTYADNPHEIHPQAGDDLTRPLRESFQERLPRLLRYFESQGKSPYVRVIATARNEQEPDKLGQLSPWDKLQWEKYKGFWQEFRVYSLVEPSDSAIVQLLEDCVAATGMRGESSEYAQIARRNDGTFRNITLNLDRARNRGWAVNDQEFSPNLDETWRQRYNKVINRYPLTVYVYDAVELLQALNLGLTMPMLFATTKLLLPRQGIQCYLKIWQLFLVFDHFVTTEQILQPKDGQIEAKKTDAVDVERYATRILGLIEKKAKRHSVNFVATESCICGLMLSNLGSHELAITAYDQSLNFQPENASIFRLKGHSLRALGQHELAIVAYEQALAIQPDNAISLQLKGHSLHDLGQHELAIVACDQALAIQPENASIFQLKGHSLRDLGQYELAITAYDQSLNFQPENASIFKLKGHSLRALGQHELAIVAYNQALAIQPDNTIALQLKVHSLRDLGQHELAIAACDQALAIEPENAGIFSLKGHSLRDLGQHELAVVAYDQSLIIQPENTSILSLKGHALRALGQYELTISVCDQALAIEPENAGIFSLKGHALRALGQYELAIAAYDQALVLQPENAGIFSLKGHSLSALGQYELAIVAYDQSLGIQPENASIFQLKGHSLHALGQHELAIVAFDEALLLQPNFPRAFNGKGVALHALGQYKLALETYEHALVLQPNYPNALYNKGIALHTLGETELAIAAYEQTLSFQPDFPMAFYGKARSYNKQGNIEQTLDSLKRAIDLDPTKFRQMASTDTIFDHIRNDDRFQALISRY